jgi:hypothetical protein
MNMPGKTLTISCVFPQVLTLQNNLLKDVPLELGMCSELKNLETRENPDLKIPPGYVRSQGPGNDYTSFVHHTAQDIHECESLRSIWDAYIL